MRYIVCEKPGQFSIGKKEAPAREKGEALLQIKKVGICGTDLHAYAGNQAFFTYPRILGHELAGTVIDIDDNPQGIQKGDDVVVMPYVSCGRCVACRNGKTNCCTNIKVLGVHTDGGMQERIAIRTDLLIPANGLEHHELALVEPLAIGAHAIRRAQLRPQETIVVMGCGPIGIGLLKLAQVIGAKTIAVDVDKGRLHYAETTLGVNASVLASEKTKEAIAEITQGDLADVVFDATGNKKALETGVDYMAHGGRYVLVGLSKGELTFAHPKIHAKETTLMCSRNATLEDFEFVMEVLRKKQFPTDSFISHTVGFEEMITHFDSWLDPANGVIKAMVNF